MILLDTNVVSELMRPRPDAAVRDWLNTSNTEDLYVSSVTIAEIYYGLELLPDGSRRADLLDRFDRLIATAFVHRVMNFDPESARHFGSLMAERRTAGRPMTTPDGQIAATARCHNFRLATRNTRDFEDCRIDLINPFDHRG